MASLKIVLYLGVCLSMRNTAMTENDFGPKAENVRWVSLDFKTILTWTTKPSNYTYTVTYSWDDSDWFECPDCTEVSASECDLTSYVKDFDRTFTADIKTEPLEGNGDFDPDELPHTYSPHFNPYKDSNISAVKFTVEAVDESRVIVNITDTLTSIYGREKQLSIREVLKNNLKYKISYYKSGSTGKRDVITDSSMAEVSDLDAGLAYCFMVAAYIPSRPKATQYGAWSKENCTDAGKEVNIGALVGAAFSLATVIIIVVTVVVLCCQKQNRNPLTTQSSQVM
ncbi:hypothetical protein Q5P01_010697 [Channa striata]|uniref:Tissue factor n=1 Tax=Channa striata TaxID=64152 RepID=A0AA88MVJ1_CHASR|nr:hypothetical protein Q5P01_010697 [Channa striata]